jgi:hypothetical protein
LSHREVFLTRQYENINANTIRWVCLFVSLISLVIENYKT